jgi:hypothetical protein
VWPGFSNLGDVPLIKVYPLGIGMGSKNPGVCSWVIMGLIPTYIHTPQAGRQVHIEE